MNIGIIGSGTMGNGIAHTFASNGYQVLLHDIKQEFLEKGVSTIQKNLNRFLDKGKITKEDMVRNFGAVMVMEKRLKLVGFGKLKKKHCI